MTRVLTVVLFALALLAAPLTTEADRAPRIPRIGVVYIRSRDPLQNGPAEVWRSLPHVQAVLAGLKERHWVEGRDFVLDIRPVEHFSHVRGQVAGLVAEKVDVLLFQTCDAEFHIARQVTRTIPIVVGPCTDDLVGKGIVASLGRPGGNITGISLLTPELSAKRLFLLKRSFRRSPA